MAVEQKDWMFGAINCDEPKLMRMLGENPSLANWQSYVDGNTALHFAAKFGNCALVRLLVGNHHADVNKRNFAGLTPLHMAAANAQKDTIILLTSNYGASIGLRDHSGRLPGEYLPPTKAGMELRKFFKDGISLLLSKSTGNKLFELLVSKSSPNGPQDERRSRSRSPVINEAPHTSPSSPTFHPNAPTSSQFPWQHEHRDSADAAHPIRDTSLSRITQCVHHSPRSRDASKERPKKIAHTVAALAGTSLRHGAQSLDVSRHSKHGKAKSRHATVPEAILADEIYASVRMRKEVMRVKYSPLNAEQKSTENAENRNGSPVARRSIPTGRRHHNFLSVGSISIGGSDSSPNKPATEEQRSSVPTSDSQSTSSGSQTPTNAI